MDKCFASSENGCRVLRRKHCIGCKFFKTHEQVTAERQQSIQRLKQIGEWDRFKDTYNLSANGLPAK